MRTSTITVLSVVCLVLSAVGIHAASVINEAEKPTFLFVVSGKSGTFEDSTLTLKDVPLVVYFSDRPQRISGMMSIEMLVKDWDKGIDSFKADPPNAVLSMLDKDSENNVVVELSDPKVDAKQSTVSFKTKVLQGELPASFDHAALFIDVQTPTLPCW